MPVIRLEASAKARGIQATNQGIAILSVDDHARSCVECTIALVGHDLDLAAFVVDGILGEDRLYEQPGDVVDWRVVVSGPC